MSQIHDFLVTLPAGCFLCIGRQDDGFVAYLIGAANQQQVEGMPAESPVMAVLSLRQALEQRALNELVGPPRARPAPAEERPVRKGNPPSAEFVELLERIETETGLHFENTGIAIGRVLLLCRLRAAYFHRLVHEERDSGLVAQLASCSPSYVHVIEEEIMRAERGAEALDQRMRRRIDEFLASYPSPIEPSAEARPA